MVTEDTATVRPPAAAAAGPRFLGIDNRFLPPILITSILLTAHLSFGILEGWERTGLAIATAIGTEVLLGYVTYGRLPHPASAYISGISVGILVRSPFLWAYALCALVSIATKYVFRVRDRHIFNPSNFGVSALLILAPASASVLSIQWGNVIWPMIIIWTLGAVIVTRAGRGQQAVLPRVDDQLECRRHGHLQGPCVLAGPQGHLGLCRRSGGGRSP